jgi:hypothetical protein
VEFGGGGGLVAVANHLSCSDQSLYRTVQLVTNHAIASCVCGSLNADGGEEYAWECGAVEALLSSWSRTPLPFRLMPTEPVSRHPAGPGRGAMENGAALDSERERVEDCALRKKQYVTCSLTVVAKQA